ncbi:MAG: hypothetical protein IT165_06580 [Bryobacterales bacterium]|nr:hypothetical protein [Bryobacterales bacterium]
MEYDIVIHINEPYELETVVSADSVEEAVAQVTAAMNEAHREMPAHEVTRLVIDDVVIGVQLGEGWGLDDEFWVQATPRNTSPKVHFDNYTVYYKLADGTYGHEVVMAASKEAAAQQTVDGLKWREGWEILGVGCV